MSYFRNSIKKLTENIGIDGPYVFYKQDVIEAISVTEKHGEYIIKEETYLYSQKDDISLKCVVDNSERDNFSFKLMTEHKIPQSRYKSQEKIFVTSDLEGNFYALSTLLKGNGIVDNNWNWIFGKNHLVIIGDIMDRGVNVTQCLWLIYKLEQEAERVGGKVHFLLGNHEVINMKGVTGYVLPKYLEMTKILDMDYYQLYALDTELGKWMRSKNSVEVIGDIAFVHAGICPEIIEFELTIDDLNEIIRHDIDQQRIEFSMKKQIVIGNKGPLWYRGLVRDTDDCIKLSMEELVRILNYLDVNKIVIGHTKADDITSDYNGKVYRTDSIQPRYEGEGKAKALIFENEVFFKTDSNGVKEKVD